jgi:hypothetical protein
MILAILESPYSGVIWRNELYARMAMKDSLARGEAPFPSHMLYPQVLDDNVPEQRDQGMRAGFAWGEFADLRVFYLDRGVSRGMVEGLKQAAVYKQPIAFRSLPEWREPLRLRQCVGLIEHWLDVYGVGPSQVKEWPRW